MGKKKKHTNNELSSPICYAQSNELREGFKDEGEERHPYSGDKKCTQSGKTSQEKY